MSPTPFSGVENSQPDESWVTELRAKIRERQKPELEEALAYMERKYLSQKQKEMLNPRNLDVRLQRVEQYRLKMRDEVEAAFRKDVEMEVEKEKAKRHSRSVPAPDIPPVEPAAGESDALSIHKQCSAPESAAVSSRPGNSKFRVIIEDASDSDEDCTDDISIITGSAILRPRGVKRSSYSTPKPISNELPSKLNETSRMSAEGCMEQEHVSPPSDPEQVKDDKVNGVEDAKNEDPKLKEKIQALKKKDQELQSRIDEMKCEQSKVQAEISQLEKIWRKGEEDMEKMNEDLLKREDMEVRRILEVLRREQEKKEEGVKRQMEDKEAFDAGLGQVSGDLRSTAPVPISPTRSLFTRSIIGLGEDFEDGLSTLDPMEDKKQLHDYYTCAAFSRSQRDDDFQDSLVMSDKLEEQGLLYNYHPPSARKQSSASALAYGASWMGTNTNFPGKASSISAFKLATTGGASWIRRGFPWRSRSTSAPSVAADAETILAPPLSDEEWLQRQEEAARKQQEAYMREMVQKEANRRK